MAECVGDEGYLNPECSNFDSEILGLFAKTAAKSLEVKYYDIHALIVSFVFFVTLPLLWHYVRHREIDKQHESLYESTSVVSTTSEKSPSSQIVSLKQPNEDHYPNLTQVWPPNSSDQDIEVEVIAIPGLGANPSTTWTKNGITWLSDPRFLPSKIPRARIWTFNYQSNIFGDGPIQRLSTIAEQLIKHVQLNLGSRNRPIVFVAHSFGGIVIAQAMVSDAATQERVLEKTTGIVTLGTPFGGTPAMPVVRKLITIAELFGIHTTRTLVERLALDNEFLQALIVSFCKLARETKLEGHCFHELLRQKVIKKPQSWIAHWLSGKLRYLIVPEQMACLDVFDRSGIKTDHTHMNEFDDTEDGNYQAVAGQIQELLRRSFAIQGARREEAGFRNPPFMVPYSLNANFVGRESVLKDIRVRMNKDNDSQKRVALCGLGGIGKTQIATKYAYSVKERCMAEGIAVYWVRGANRERFTESYAEIAREAKIPIDQVEDKLRRVATWLQNERNGPWLMIIDNADDIEIFRNPHEQETKNTTLVPLSHYIPECSHGSVLFTSRDKRACVDLAGSINWIHVDKMDIHECRFLIQSSLQKSQCSEGVDELAAALEHLPLALVQAVSFITKSSITVRKYLEMYAGSEEARLKLLSTDFLIQGRDVLPNAVAATWIISFQQILSKEPLAAYLLSYMSFLDRQDIPEGLLPWQDDETDFRNALGVLQAFSMVTQNNKSGFDMHALIQLSMREWLRIRKEADNWVWFALEILRSRFPLDDYRDWPICERYLLHAQALLKHEISDSIIRVEDGVPIIIEITVASTRFEVHVTSELELLLPVAWFLYLKGQSKRAAEYQSRGLKTALRLLGEAHSITLQAMSDLAVAYSDTFREEEAFELVQKLVEVKKKNTDSIDDELAYSLDALARRLNFRGRHEEAEEMQLEVLSYWKETYGPKGLQTLKAMHNLIHTLKCLGRHAEVWKMSIECIQGLREVLDPEDPQLLRHELMLAETYYDNGLKWEARHLITRTIHSQRKILGHNHPNTLESIELQAHACKDVGDKTGAERLYTEVLQGRTLVLGEENDHTITSMLFVAGSLKDVGRYADAVVLLRKAIRLRSKMRGPDHSSVTELSEVLSEWVENAEPYDLIPSNGYYGNFQPDYKYESPWKKTLLLKREFEENGRDVFF